MLCSLFSPLFVWEVVPAQQRIVSGSERSFSSWIWLRTPLLHCRYGILHDSWELKFFPICVTSRTKAEARLWNKMAEYCLPPCERQTSFRWFCLLLISKWNFRCVSHKTWVWIPEGCALFAKTNTPSAHVDVENVFSILEVVLPAIAQKYGKRESVTQVKLKENNFWFGSNVKFSIWSGSLLAPLVKLFAFFSYPDVFNNILELFFCSR